MRVLCIDGEFPIVSGYSHINGCSIENSIYNVVNSDTHMYLIQIYELAEFPPDLHGAHWFGAHQFVPISDIKEELLSEEQCEAIRERQTQLI